MKSGFYSSGLHLSSLIWLSELLWESRRGILSAVKRVCLLLDFGGEDDFIIPLEELSCLDFFAGPSQLRLIGCRDITLMCSL